MGDVFSPNISQTYWHTKLSFYTNINCMVVIDLYWLVYNGSWTDWSAWIGFVLVNHMISSAIWNKKAQVNFSKTNKIWGLWKIYKCLFIPNCTKSILWLLNNMYIKKFKMVKQNKRTCITQSGKNYAINYCTIQGVRLIWKQKIWLAISKFVWLLTNQNAWFVSSFCTELTLFEKNCTSCS